MNEADQTNTILPGATIGILGTGQLGRMFAIEARRLGYQIHVFSPDVNTPAGQVADLEIVADYEDIEAVTDFAKEIDVATYEFENVPATTVQAIEEFAPVRPGAESLRVAQNRVVEKTFLRSHGLPTANFCVLNRTTDFEGVPVSFPAVLKTATSGYDGKGQAKVEAAEDLFATWQQLETQEAILEEFVDYKCEFSVIGVRGLDGDFTSYGPILNDHANHILDVSTSPAGLPDAVNSQAVEIAQSIMEELDAVGVLCVELFLDQDDNLLINEIAPRPHNSGHLTIDAHHSCQFEQQVRAVCGLPLGNTNQFRHAIMLNLLGDLWEHGTPPWEEILSLSNVKLHLYGKAEPRKGRKMGHLTVCGETAEESLHSLERCRKILS